MSIWLVVTSLSDVSASWIVTLYAPLGFAAWSALWVTLIATSRKFQTIVLENYRINHAVQALTELLFIGLHQVALVVSRDALVFYNGAFTLLMLVATIGIVAIATGWRNRS